MRSAKEDEGETDDILEPSHVVKRVLELGAKRLNRPTFGHGITAFLGGLAVSFGVIAIAYTGGPWLETLGLDKAAQIGALGFPIGFVILILGRGELFTENFLIPVVGVLEKRGKLRDLLLLWVITLVCNLLAAALFAYGATRPGILEGGARDLIRELALKRMESSFGAAFAKAVFAGWLMTLLTWAVVAVRNEAARFMVIWALGFLLSASHFNHVIVSASEIFISMGAGSGITIAAWALHNLLPAVLGNLIGGVILVTLFTYAQAQADA